VASGEDPTRVHSSVTRPSAIEAQAVHPR
jgi:hypothetical protein